MNISSKNDNHQQYGFKMRLQARLIIFFILFIACSKIHVLKIDFTTEQPKKFTPQQAFDLTRAYHQVTTHPEIDAYPSISPNGQWIAFASRRSGNMDIWIKPIKGGSAIQITTHRTDDIMPSWSPDGKQIVFVSYSDDATGDLWIVSLKKKGDKFSVRGDPKKITHYLGMDITPTFSPDGKYIAFTSDRDGEQNIYLLQLNNQNILKITHQGGINPTWSPDGHRIAFVSFIDAQSHYGQVFYANLSFKSKVPSVTSLIQLTSEGSNDAFPYWNPLKDEIFFCRYDRDTNVDGQITPEDKPGLWKIIIEQDSTLTKKKGPEEYEDTDIEPTQVREEPQHYFQELQLMPTLSYDYFPVCGSDSCVYFVSQRSGNDDIWSIPADGIIPRMDDPFLQYQFSVNYFPLPYSDLIFKPGTDSIQAMQLQERLLAFNRVSEFFPREYNWVGWSQYEIARTYHALGNHDLARVYFEEILTQFKQILELPGEIELRLFELNFDSNPEKLNPQVEQLRQVIDRFQDYPQIQAEAQLFLGEVYFLHGRYAFALKVLEELIDHYPEQTEKCALAQLLIGEIYKKFGQTEEVINSFLQVIQNYPSQEVWVDTALNRILNLETSDDFNSVISIYQNIIARYGQYRRLVSRAQLRIGEKFFQRKDYEAAIEELYLVSTTYADQRSEVARAELILAKIYLKNGEELRAINQYKKVINEYGDVQGGLFVVQAKEELLAIYLESGKRYRLAGERDAAYSRYREAVKMFPRNIEANRGMIAAMYSLGMIDQALKMYENARAKQPNDEILLYMLGLCYSYKATERSDRTQDIENFDPILMKKSNKLIKTALSKNYRLIQAYLTLSYNYEFIETYESALRTKKRGFFASAVQTLVAPIKTLVHWITFYEEKPPRQWFEQAIDALTTAYVLNDEKKDPQLESEIALNLANNYYNLEEFGFERAYHYYQIKLQYDTTFVTVNMAARIYKQIGHCALVVEDFENGPKYLEQAIRLYRDLGDEENWLLNIKRLALLYQLAEDYESSVDYFKIASQEDEKKKRYNQLLADYRSMAYNYQLLNDEEEALRYANKALDLLRDGKAEKVKSKPNWIKIGVMGIEFPIWNLGQIGAGFSTAAEGFTTDEEIALLYSVMGQAEYGQKSIPGAINYLNKKLEIYRKKKDKITEAIFLNNIGYLYFLDLNYSKAWEYFDKSFNICKDEENAPGILINVLNLGNIGVQINKLRFLPSDFILDSLHYEFIHESSKFLTLSFDYAHFGLSRYEKEPIGFLNEKAQLYHLLGNLHFLNNLYLPDSLKKNHPLVIQQQIKRFEDLAIADSCYRSALEIAKENNFKIDQIIAYQNLGQISFALGDMSNAIIEFTKARELAIERNLLSQLWQINFALGQILSIYEDNSRTPHVSKDANFYYNEAINTFEQIIFQSQTTQNSPFYRYQVRMLYQTVIDYSISRNRMINALRLTEQYRGKTYLDFISNHRLELKKERHKVFFGNARSLIEEINEKTTEILLAKEKESRSESEIIELLREKRELIHEYRNLIDEYKKEDPELESFVHVEPVTYVQLQKILDSNCIIVNYFISGQKTYLWTISADSITFKAIPVTRDSINYHIDQFLTAINSNQMFEHPAQWLWHNLFQPITDQIGQSNKIIFVPDGSINRIPFSFLKNFAFENNSSIKKVMITPSLSDYYFSYQKRQIRGTRLLWGGVDATYKIEDAGFTIENLTNGNSRTGVSKSQFIDHLQNADIIYLDIQFEPNNNDPLISVMTPISRQKMSSLQLRELYRINLQASLTIINGIAHPETPSFFALERALLYAGAPSIIISLWSNSNNQFWDYFFEALLDYSVVDAFLHAQIEMRRAGCDPKSYAGYQLIGFEGMNDEEEKQFAQERFESKVRMANSYYNDNAWSDALRNYEQALIMAKKQGDLESINILYNFIIKSAALGGFYDKAISYQLDVIDIAKANNDIQKMAEGYNNLVHFYTEKKKYDQAVFYQNEYLKLAERYGLRIEMASSYRNIGLVYERGGNYEKAIDYFSKAIESFREIGDSTNIAVCSKDRGRIYLLYLDNYSKAIEDQEQALKIFKDQNNIENTIEVLQNLGFSHEKLANYQVALKYQLEAYQLAQRLENPYWNALSQQYLANVSWKMGNYEQALKYQKHAIQIFENFNNLKLQSAGLTTQGLIFMSLGNLEEAIKNEQQALELAQNIDARQDMATIHTNLGLMYRSQGQLEVALEHFQQAIQIVEAIDYKRGLGYGYMNLGSVYLQHGKTDMAFKYFRKALKISQEILDGRNEVKCLYQIGNAYHSLNKTKMALDTLNITAEKAEKMFIPEVEWRAHRLIGQIHFENKYLEESLSAYLKALSVIENMRSQIKVEEYKAGFIDDKLDVYSDLVNLYIQLEQPGKALEIVERAKSRNFIDLLSNREIKFSGSFSEQNLEQGKNIQDEIRRIQNEISGLIVKGVEISVPEKEKLNILNKQLQDLKQKYEEFLVELKEQNSELADMVTVEPPNIDSLKTILPNNVIALEYFYTDDKLFIWVIRNNRVIAIKRNYYAAELISQVEALRKALGKQMSILNISQQLYNLLIAPIEADFARSEHIVIIPHGILHYLPFAALLDGNQKYLIEKYSLSIAPSATVLDICMNKGQPYLTNKDKMAEILALGNPDLNNPQYELPFAEREIESIQLIYPKVISYTNKDATEKMFKESCATPNMILLSCHGEFDATNPLFSSLLLAPDQENDGRLEAHEIFSLNMNAYLVVMSACETGLAKIGIGDELIGLSRSFFYAGSSSLISSLWKVDDLATAVMIKRFFRYLKEGDSRAHALQKALIFVKDQINVHPAYWAAFNITGDFR